LLGVGNDKAFLSFTPGTQIRAGILSSSFIYSDGTKSMGVEKNLNGQYRSFRLHFLLGLKAGFAITKLVTIEASAQWLPGSVKKGSVNDLSLDYERNMGGDINFKTYFPLDIAEYNNPNVYSYDELRNDARSLRFTLGFRFNLSFKDQ
jgi:hypothetical protein